MADRKMREPDLPPHVRELRSPLTDAMLAPLEPGPDAVIQMPAPLAAKDLPRASAYVAKHPEIWLRLYDLKGKSWPIAFLKDFPGLRALQVDFDDGRFTDLAALEDVTPRLEALVLPVTPKPKTNLDRLARFPDLRALMLSGKVDDLGVLARLPKLEELTLHKVALDDLSALAPLAGSLRSLQLRGGTVKRLDGIEKLTGLRELEIVDTKGPESLDPILACRSLESLDLRLVKSGGPVPSLAPLVKLARLTVIGTPPALSIADAWAAPALRTLELHGYDVFAKKAPLEALPRHAALKAIFLGYQDEEDCAKVTGWCGVRCVEEPGELAAYRGERAAGSSGDAGCAADVAGKGAKHDDSGNADPDPDEYDRISDALDERVARAVKGECLVSYDAAPLDADGLPVDNLDEIAHEGPCRFVQGKYRSAVVESPTWLQVAVLANAMIRKTGDEDHRFLEGIDVTGEDDSGVAILAFSMGS